MDRSLPPRRESGEITERLGWNSETSTRGRQMPLAVGALPSQRPSAGEDPRTVTLITTPRVLSFGFCGTMWEANGRIDYPVRYSALYPAKIVTPYSELENTSLV
ncbi:hypothetical protein chiPu_0009906 [Chiloscyllium punctatum]|uniref:Uncharacterized protein n=1 Tax=Chiloscyllium punctatum TaxID=137246 RepID=A0A401SM45_CHIPU|nr:hypothetical protein [Chiloscyllium punctatum]